jgi:hypothetical protein
MSLGIKPDVMSQILNEKRDRPDLIRKIWKALQASGASHG